MVRAAGVGTEYIVLEITESAAMTDVALALENLARLCMNGFALSIDDFGTGYSSVQQLTRIAFSELKIDQSFVKDFTDNAAMGVVVESSIDMAHKLGMNILVVDDDDFTRKLVLSVLRNLGFGKVTDTNNAESAIKLLESNPFDVVVTDINMPGMNGLEFIKMIRAGRTLAQRETRFVVLTSFSQTEILATALALDINGFLVKPITPAMVNEKLVNAMAEKLHLHPPLAYEAVRTKLQRLSATEVRPQNAYRGASIPLPAPPGHGSGEGRSESLVALQRLRPGMVLSEDIHLPDGTLLLSSGHVFTELSINRLYDLGNLLKRNHVAIEAPETDYSK